MPMLDIPVELDDKLREIAPSYLQGDTDRTRRIFWAVDEFLRLRKLCLNTDLVGRAADPPVDSTASGGQSDTGKREGA